MKQHVPAYMITYMVITSTTCSHHVAYQLPPPPLPPLDNSIVPSHYRWPNRYGVGDGLVLLLPSAHQSTYLPSFYYHPSLIHLNQFSFCVSLAFCCCPSLAFYLSLHSVSLFFFSSLLASSLFYGDPKPTGGFENTT